ncbi:MAG: DUF4339 domain-containing protein [Chthoniobacterales bacterium]
MADEWMVRVAGKEYGPVDLETLREWRDDGRLIRENPVQNSAEQNWITAGEIDGLFPVAAVTDERIRARTLSEIMSETLRIYWRGFPQFFCLALLVGVPSLVLKLTLAFVNVSNDASPRGLPLAMNVIGVVAFACVLFAWPIFIAGLQLAVAHIADARPINLSDIIRRASALWRRIASLSVVVYASYIFWTVIPVLAILTLISGTPSIILLFVALAILGFQVYMAGRLFVNFMFWQQTATLGGLEGIEALRESKELARSRPGAPRLHRPLYRGAILASAWLLIFLVLSSGAELPFVLVRLQGITNLDDARTLMQSMMNAAAPDAMTIASYVITTLIHAALRPLLGIAFVVLYFDARSSRPDTTPDENA